MLNVALALNIFFVMVWLLIFREALWLGDSPRIFSGLVVGTYCLLRFTDARHHVRPTMTVHGLFAGAYAIPVIAWCILVVETKNGGGYGVGAGLFVVLSLLPASILLIVGLFILAVSVIRSIKQHR